MKQKWLVVGALSLAELAVCAGILAVTWGGVRWARETGLQISAFDFDAVSAEADEEQRFAVSGPASLDLDNLAGKVQIVAGAGSEIVVRAHKTAWGADQAEAEAALAGLRVTMTQAGSTVTVKVQKPSEIVLVGTTRGSTVDFEIEVPARTDVKVVTGFGAIELSGVNGAVDLETGSGKVLASAVEGGVTLRSDFGDVTLERSSAGAVTASTTSGTVRLSEVDAEGEVVLTSGFGAIEFTEGTAAALTAETSSGAVEVSDVTLSGPLTADSDFGQIVVTRVSAPGGYDLRSESGGISVDGASGSLQAESGFGDVSVVNATEMALEVHSNSGAVTFSGSLGAGPHSVTTDFGHVRLLLPAATAATLDLTTGFGSIRSDLPVTLSGDLDDDHWQGTLNGGGPSLTVETASGNISLEPLNS